MNFIGNLVGNLSINESKKKVITVLNVLQENCRAEQVQVGTEAQLTVTKEFMESLDTI